MKRPVALLLLTALCAPLAGRAQDTLLSIFAQPIEMDAVTVKATRAGWDLQAFIRRVQTDTTFFKAFKGLRVVGWTAQNDIRILDAKGGVRASLQSTTRQAAARGCRTMHTLAETTTGDFYKSPGVYRYYTAELYAHLFFTKGKVCGESDVVGATLGQRGKGGLEKSKAQLKQLVFNPGARVSGVPFMGDRASVFSPDVAKKYTFHLTSETYAGEECWVFKAVPKPEHRSEVVYNELTTWFRKSDYSIPARDYSLSFRTALYDFSVRMKVRLAPIGTRLLPTRIDYDGVWRVATQGRERARFSTVFTY